MPPAPPTSVDANAPVPRSAAPESPMPGPRLEAVPQPASAPADSMSSVETNQPVDAPAPSPGPAAQLAPSGPAPSNGHAAAAPSGPVPANGRGGQADGQGDRSAGCTAPQLRRFIKSRPYVPMHELRRRFAIDGGDDDVTQVRIDDSHVYVGLPSREGSLLGDLLRGGEIGYELSLDPRTPVVIGVYPMRPVPRG